MDFDSDVPALGDKKEITKCFCLRHNFIAIESYILNKLELIALWCSKCQNTKIWSVYFFFFFFLFF